MTDGQTSLAHDDHEELAASLERALKDCDDPVDADELRMRLARIYLGALPDVGRAAALAEELLAREEVATEAFQVAGALLQHPDVAPRAAELLSTTYGRLGRVDSEASALAAELDIARPARHDAVRLRLAELRYRELGDPAGAMDLVEALVTKDPGHDEVRRLYLDIAQSLGSPIRAAETLARAAKKAKAVEVRERVGFEVGSLYLQEGELKQARGAFLDVVLAEGVSLVAIAASRKLLDLESEPGDPLVLGAALETIARGSSDPAARQDAAARLLLLHEDKPFKESRLAVAYQALVDTDRADEALEWLGGFHRRHGDKGGLAGVYRRQALRAKDPGTARALALQSIELHADESDVARAEHWLWFVRTYGPDRRAHAELLVLLEQTGRADDLCRVLEAEVDLAGPEERPALLARLGHTRLVALGDTEGALAALGRCLALDPSNENARSIVESLMAAGPGRLAAADVLEPLYREGRDREGELRVLETRAELLADAEGRVASLARAVDVAAQGLKDDTRALQLCRRGLAIDASSPELLGRLDALLAPTERVTDRLARYEEAAAEVVPPRRARLLRTVAAIRRDELGDLRGAVAAWEKVVADDPADVPTYEELSAATARLGDHEGALAWIERARSMLRGPERDRMSARLAEALVAQSAVERALELCREIVGVPEVDAEALRAVAEIASDQRDEALYRKALGHAPLLELYASTGDWLRLPDALRVSLDATGDMGAVVLLLLRLEASAVESSAVGAFVELADEIAGKLGKLGPDLRAQARAVARARARVLGSDRAQSAPAVAAYRKLVEEFGDDEVVGDFESFVESMEGREAQHEARRWLFRWRAANAVRPAEALLAWARAEEAYGASDAAISVYERLAESEAERRVALAAVCRLKLHEGDLAGGLAAHRALRDDCGTDDERLSVDLRVVQLLGQEHYPVEAAAILAPTLAAVPPIEEAHKLAREMLSDPASRNEVATRIAETAAGADDVTALRIYAFLLSGGADDPSHAASEGASARGAAPRPAMAGRRRQWYQRVADLSRVDPEVAFAMGAHGVLEFPDAVALWDGLERIARELGRFDDVAVAYRRALVERVTDSSLAESLGRRMAHFEDACAIESIHSTDALLKVLELAPGARWALDRVKLVLGAQARYGELFAAFDRAIAGAPDDRERAELLSEAAFAARDLAGLPQRAITYLTDLHGLRPDDATIDSALERLYEKLGRRVELIALLDKRVARSAGFKRRDLRRRMVTLWLDLGDAAQANAVLGRLLESDAFVADVVDLLERLLAVNAPAAVHDRTIALLCEHYEKLGSVDDVVRVAERALALATGDGERARRMRDLVGLRFRAASREPGVFAHLTARVESDVAGDRALAKTAYRALLRHALRAMRTAKRDGADGTDAAHGSFASVQRLTDILLDGSDPAAAFALLRRASRVPFAGERRRDLLRGAALVCAERLGDAPRAIRLFEELYAEDPGDDAAARSLAPFAALLEATGQHVKLARLWEKQAEIRAKAGNAGEERACWERAAALWEHERAWEQAIAAHRRGAALGSEASFEALARIHADRREWSEAAKALEWVYVRATADTKSERALRLAEAYAALEQRDKARACLEESLRAATEPAGPEGAAPMDAARLADADAVRTRLIGLYRQDEVWLPLARLLAADARRAEDPRQKLALLREAADLYRSKLGEADEAASLLDAAVALDPNDAVLRATLVEVLEGRLRWEEAATVLRGQVALFGDHRSRERAVVHRRLARALVHANRREDAFTELRHAVEMYPAHPGSLFDLARVALDLDRLDLSERTYRALLLVVHGGGADEGAAHGPSRVDVFVDLSEVAMRRGDGARAADLVDTAFDEALERGEDPERLERGLRTRGRYELLGRALERRVERGATLSDRASALAHLAELWEAHLGRPADIEGRIRQSAERIARDLGHEDVTESAPWAALATVYARFDDGRKGGPLTTLLETAVAKVKSGADRSRLRVILAKTLLDRAGALDAAVATLDSALADDPAGPEANALLTDVLERQGRYDELAILADRRLRALPAESPASEFVQGAWKLAGAIERAGRSAEALPVYESVLDRRPDDRELTRVLGDRLEALGSKRTADCLERLVELDPAAGATVARRLVELRDKQGEAAGIVRALEIAAPGDRGSLLRLVDAYRKAGEDRHALRILDVAVAARPGDAEVLVLRSAVRERAGDGDGAVSDLEAASVADARHVNALLEMLGRIANADDSGRADAHAMRLVETLVRLNRPKQARRELERLLARSPQHVDALGKIGALAAAEGSWELAASAYLKLLLVVEKGAQPERLARVAVATADASERAGQLDAARPALQRAIDVLAQGSGMAQELERLCRVTRDWPRLAGVFVMRAEQEPNVREKTDLLLRAGRVLLEECGDPVGAMQVLERCRATAPENLEGLLLWARAQVALGRPQAALAELYRAAERNRGKRSPLLASVYLEIAKAHLAGDELVEALEALDFGFAVDWRVGDLAMLLGIVAYDLGEEKVAVRAFSAVTTLPPRKDAVSPGADAATKAVAFYHLASIAVAQGDLARAKRLATKAVGGDPGHAPARALFDKLNAQPDIADAKPK